MASGNLQRFLADRTTPPSHTIVIPELQRINRICRNLINRTSKLIPSHQPFGICTLWAVHLRKHTSRPPMSWTYTLEGVPGNPPMFRGESGPMSWSYPPTDTTNRQTNPARVLARKSPCGGKPLGSKRRLETCDNSWRATRRNNPLHLCPGVTRWAIPPAGKPTQPAAGVLARTSPCGGEPLGSK